MSFKELHRNRPQWLRHRTLGECGRFNKMPTSRGLMQSLKLEACLEGHSGCVNCLEWNQKGNLLASGSDDRNVVVWNAFRGTKESIVKTDHQGNIFSVKFMPEFSDTMVATCASDGAVKITDTITSKSIMNCDSCHVERIKRLATHQNVPNLVWSAGEEGYILQYDIREQHICGSSRPKNLLIDLKTINSCLAAKCLAINPIRDEMLAVGSNDIYNRLFDRRYLNQDASNRNSCTAYFTPGHLPKSNKRPNHRQSFGTTNLAFSPNGSELLASVHAEQVYLFNTYEPWERYKSFESSLKPLLLDKPPPLTSQVLTQSSRQVAGQLKRSKLKPYLHWHELKKRFKSVCVPDEHRELYEKASEELRKNCQLSKITSDKINELLLVVRNCPELYRLRASALINRGWKGDYYQALRDCCCALALKPLDYRTINRLAIIICRLGDREATIGLLDMIGIIMKEFGGDRELLEAVDLLSDFKRESASYNGESFEEDGVVMDSGNYIDSMASIFIPQLLSSDIAMGDLEGLSFSVQQEQSRKEQQRCASAFDFSKRFCGHCNMNTDIKEASFFGSDGEFIVGGSDDGAFYIWDKQTTNIVKAVHADFHILNCVQPHPSICMLATSGIESTVKLWSTNGKTCRDVDAIESRCLQNQDCISIDPLEAMIMMLYPDREL